MLTVRDLVTIRVALRYWQEEMGPHGIPGMRPYYLNTTAEPLSSQELDDLGKRLRAVRIRYVGLDYRETQLADLRIWNTEEELVRDLPSAWPATLIMPTN
ncbi:hypothetical protein [Blastopirellula marina]|uniref:Uncharacterized protein n=1 Tax=Blastopirellula marina TaxID=124 RepID=A0A2S8F9X2_9BACT|nr:hypothetical protein [Blastopirellula marina]PQO28941.1 hypothetical protein C5Y98_24590 [Blastopirellula marina]PTL42214.1 hypothetical protein C5Y97_24605 [Blastopirellula marina]